MWRREIDTRDPWPAVFRAAQYLRQCRRL